MASKITVDEVDVGTSGLNAEGDIVLDDGAGDSPQIQLVGGSNDDTAKIWLDNSLVSQQSDLILNLPGSTSESSLQVQALSGVIRLWVGGEGNVGVGVGKPSILSGCGLTGKVLDVEGIVQSTHNATGDGGIVFGSGNSSYMLPLFFGISESDSHGMWFLAEPDGAGDTGFTSAALIFEGRKQDNSALTTGDLVQFHNGGSAKVTINTGGDVGIGTSTPKVAASGTYGASTILNVYEGTNFARVVVQGNSYGAALDLIDLGGGADDKWMQLRCDGGIAKFMSIEDDLGGAVADNIIVMDIGTGQVGVGTAPSQDFHVSGTIRASNLAGGATNLTCDANADIIRDPSDIRLKKDIQPIEGALDKVLRLRGVSHRWKPEANMGDQRDIGLVAQEVVGVVPELVSHGEDGLLGVKYNHAVALLVEAIKEQQEEIASLRAELDDLKLQRES